MTITVVEKLNSAIDFLEHFYLENKKFLQKDVKFVFLRQDLEHDFPCACQCGGNTLSERSVGGAQGDHGHGCTEARSEKYDRIVANHLWDFIVDKDALMEKAKGVLDKDGFMLSTYSSYGFMEEVNRLFASVDAGVDFTDLTARQQSRRKQLEQILHTHFAKVRRDVFQNHLTGITDAKVLTGYIEKHYPKEYAANASVWKEVIRKVNQKIAEQGALEILTYAPLYQCGQSMGVSS